MLSPPESQISFTATTGKCLYGIDKAPGETSLVQYNTETNRWTNWVIPGNPDAANLSPTVAYGKLRIILPSTGQLIPFDITKGTFGEPVQIPAWAPLQTTTTPSGETAVGDWVQSTLAVHGATYLEISTWDGGSVPVDSWEVLKKGKVTPLNLPDDLDLEVGMSQGMSVHRKLVLADLDARGNDYIFQTGKW